MAQAVWMALHERARPFVDSAVHRVAVEIYEGSDATRDVLRAETALRDLGARRGPRGADARPETGWDGLTPSERTIADLVAEGLSNP